MTIEELKMLFELLGYMGVGAILGGGIIFFILKSFIPSYLSEKAKNLAQKEDIEALTVLVEDVRHKYNSLLEERKERHQLRLSAIDRRLEAHQLALALWRELNSTLGTEDVNETLIKYDNFWNENSLYLEPNARKAFLSAWIAARNIELYKKNGMGNEYMVELYKTINDLGDAISEAVELPPLNEQQALNESKA